MPFLTVIMPIELSRGTLVTAVTNAST